MKASLTAGAIAKNGFHLVDRVELLAPVLGIGQPVESDPLRTVGLREPRCPPMNAPVHGNLQRPRLDPFVSFPWLESQSGCEFFHVFRCLGGKTEGPGDSRRELSLLAQLAVQAKTGWVGRPLVDVAMPTSL